MPRSETRASAELIAKLAPSFLFGATPQLFILFVVLMWTESTSAGPLMMNQPDEQCFRVRREFIFDKPNCELQMVRINACAGYCRSASFYDIIDKRYKIHQTKCCRMTDFDVIKTELTCMEDGLSVKKNVSIPTATNCACSDCGNHLSEKAHAFLF